MEVVVSSNAVRDYRKGNWTMQETMVLIDAKRMDNERRLRRQAGESSGGGERGKPTELRWKWVEDYCWSNGCLRSQNQCNDKWDNLMRDFKKVMDYERRLAEKDDDDKSYWKLERNERKENNLPTNMVREIYEALLEVVDMKGQRVVGVGGGSSSPFIHHLPPPIAALPLPPPPPPPAVAVAAQTPPLHYQHQPHYTTQPFPRICDSSEPETSEHSDSPAKRRRMGMGMGMGVEGTTSGTHQSGNNEVGPAISTSAKLIAEAIHSCEEREERRHREMLSLHQRRLEIEESKAEINRQGINGLVDAINKLANSILALATNHNNHPPPPAN